MEKIEVICPNGHRLKASPKLMGKRVACPKCNAAILIPATEITPVDLSSFNIETEIGTALGQPATGAFASDSFSSDSPAYPDPWASMENATATPSPNPYNYYAASAAKPAQKQSKNVTRNQFTSPAVIATLAVAGGLVASLLVFALIATLRFTGSGSTKPTEVPSEVPSVAKLSVPAEVKTTYAPAHPANLFESQLLRDELYRFMDELSGSPDEPDVQRDIRLQRENGFSGYLLVTKEEEEALRSGIPFEGTQEKIRLLISGFSLLGYSQKTVERKLFAPNPAGERVYADQLASSWRQYIEDIAFSRKLDKEACKKIREIEDRCFGEDSIFQPLVKRITVAQTEKERLAEQFPKIAKAFAAFETKYGQLPNEFGAPALKTKGLSWRVALLPFLGHQELYDKFHLDESWDSDHNKGLVEQIPEAFVTNAYRVTTIDPAKRNMVERLGEIPPEQAHGLTSYQIVVGPGSIFDGSKRTMKDVVGNSRKMLFIVLGKRHLEPWTKPGGFPMDNSGMQLVDAYFYQGTPFCTFDGSSRLLIPSSAGVHVSYSSPNKPPQFESEFDSHSRPLTAEIASLDMHSFATQRARLRSRLFAVERKK